MRTFTIWGISLMMLFSACNPNRTDQENIDKLLDRQAKVDEALGESFENFARIKDSLTSQKLDLINQRESKDLQIRDMEKSRQFLADQLKEEEAYAVSSRKNELEDQIAGYVDSISMLKSELNLMNTHLDSIEKSLSFYDIQENQTEKALESGINEIDQRMTSRENRRRQETKKMGLLKRRVMVADKKIEAYDLERQMYVEERDGLLRSSASEDNLAPYREKISYLDSLISSETKNKNSLNQEIKETQTFVDETDSLMEELQSQIKQEYDKKEIIEDFIASEKARLQKELEQIKFTRTKLLAEQSSISAELNRTEQQIKQMHKNVELIRNKKMSDILDLQASIEQSDANLAQEEIVLLEEAPEREAYVYNPGSDSASEELSTLMTMGSELDSLNDLIQAEKSEIAKTRKELSEKRARVAAQRARLSRTAGVVLIILVFGGIALLGLFYFLGRRSRKDSNI